MKIVEKPHHFNFKDLENKKFSRLLVIGYAGRIKIGGQKYTEWYCKCDCGNIIKVRGGSLVSGDTKSCGCFRVEKRTTHGGSRKSEYFIYKEAKARCRNPNHYNYKDYGGRGIEFRFNSFVEFLNVVGHKPSPNYTLERMNNEGHYEVGNVRWDTRRTQARNQRDNHLLEYNNETKCISEWAEIVEISSSTITSRINNHKWCTACSLEIKPRKGNCPHR